MSAKDQLPINENKHLRQSVFNVPDHYFENAKVQLFSEINLDKTLSATKEQTGFKTPVNYQQELNNKIFAAIAVEKIKEQVTKDGFTAPDDYFNTFSNRLKAKINTPQKSAKIYQLTWVKQAIAACVVLAFSFALMLNYRQSNNFEKELSAIPDETIVNYLNTNTDVTDMPVIIENINEVTLLPENQDNLSSEEIEQYLNSSI